MKFVKKFETDSQRTQYEGGSEYIEPYVSLVTENSSVHYNKPYFCKLTLNNGSKVELHGSGVLTSAMTRSYKSTLVSAEIGELCTSIGSNAFDNCSGLTSVTIGNSVTSIGDTAFGFCEALTNVTIGNSVTNIGNNAFRNCSGLKSIDIPDSVKSIGIRAFYYCTGFTSIDIPSSVTSIGSSAFQGCTSLPIIDNIRYADTCAVEAVDKTLSTYTIKQGTRFIDGAFASCSNLTSVTIPNSVTSIGGETFARCFNLTSVTIPNSVTSIGGTAFSSCGKLTSVTIPNSVTSIGDFAFDSCGKLASVTIGNGVTSIGNGAFYNCTGLTSVTVNATTAPSIQSNTFQNIKTNGTLTVPSGSTGYDVWMGTGNYYLGLYGWTKVEQ